MEREELIYAAMEEIKQFLRGDSRLSSEVVRYSSELSFLSSEVLFHSSEVSFRPSVENFRFLGSY